MSTIIPIPATFNGVTYNDGVLDATAVLQNWLNNIVLDGSFSDLHILRAPGSSQYRIEGTWHFGSSANPTLNPRQFLTLDLFGGTFFCTVQNPYGIEAASDVTNNWFSYTNHGLDNPVPMQIANGISKTTGLSNKNTYWSIRVNANLFRLATSQANALAGIAINLGGTSDSAVSFRNAPTSAVNPSGIRAFLYSTDFPGNANYGRPMISMEGGTNLRITSSASSRGQIVGASLVSAFNSVYEARYEGQLGIGIFGTDNVEVDSVDVLTTLGDNIECIASTTYGRSNGVHLHDFSAQGSGRHGVTFGNGGVNGAIIEDYLIFGAPRHLMDIENDNPNGSGGLDGIVIRRGIRKYGVNTLGDIAMGGAAKSVSMTIGGTEGNPQDGNLVLGGAMSCDEGNKVPDGIRRGPLVYNYNIGGGGFTLHTHGTTTAEYTGYVNPSAGTFTDAQIMGGQHIAATSLPNPCNITSVTSNGNGTGTITLSHLAKNTSVVSAVFGSIVGSQAGAGGAVKLGTWNPNPVDSHGNPLPPVFNGYDGVQGIGNTFVLQPGSAGEYAFNLTQCSAIDVRGNIVYGGSGQELHHVHDFVSGPSTETGTASMLGGGLFGASATAVTSPGKGLLLGGGVFTASASVEVFVGGGVPIKGGGAFAATGTSFTPNQVAGIAVLLGGGVYEVIGTPEVIGVASMLGGGSFDSSGIRYVDGAGVASMAGGGDLEATGVRETTGTTVLDNGGVFAVVGVRETLGIGGLACGGAFAADSLVEVPGTADLAVGGAFAASGTAVAPSTETGGQIGAIRLRGPGFGVGPFGIGPFGGDV